MADSNNPNRLLVEGKDDLHSIVHLMRPHVGWPEAKTSWPVHIEEYGGIENLIAPATLMAELKRSGLRNLGIVVDADTEDTQIRYGRLRGRCLETFPELGTSLPTNGLVATNGRGMRLGIWIMPDNSTPGYLETFLTQLVPEADSPLMTHAEASLNAARNLGSRVRPIDQDKAKMHTFLAWEHPPGQPFGTALTARTLSPNSPFAQNFVNWFRSLYGL